ncbi:DNA repair protein RecN [Mycetocola manganoxydans]|uniref:DNA repair protein RecN n=1 Tax=Mycetocola manganoxydans TaxID=699879 RepID=A0A3L6ZMF5_9MICO|nr:DNA repair protein RecN [Mycetocola manganoxydans]RLP69080.1 DNA repair protein RecN [Mycetocola manganoxydans]GHD51585.1 DNA repair protein RecN [Mycetocola manganoxydans]
MIEEIGIRDLGVIAEATLPLGAGFTAITGETGAGKTMVVTALGLLLGGRSDSGVIRQGNDSTSVDGRWIVPAEGSIADRVREAGGDVDPFGDDAELTLARSVLASGRSRASVGGRSAPVGVLAELGEQLVVVHGQSEQVRLRSQAAQRDALDRFAGDDLTSVLTDYRSAFRRYVANAAERDTLVEERDRRAAEADELRLTIAEIDAVAPQPGEDDELATRAERLTNLEDLRIAAAFAREALSAEESDGPDVVGLLDAARRQLERVASHDAELGTLGEQLASTSYAVSEIALELSRYLAGLDTDGARELEVLQDRRAELAILMRKYGPGIDDVIATHEAGNARLLELDGDSDRIDELTAIVEADAALVDELATRLSEIRRDAAARLGDAISTELSALAMPDATVVIDVTDQPELGQHGRDAVVFLMQPHPGAEPRPISKGASGGELSRVMLAIEVVIAGRDPVPTFVFDEVDAGVGGSAAIEIGRRLARLAESAQVIVVTHLAQVAAFATNHLAVVKSSDGTVTASSVRQLTGQDRVAEMARLLSGLADSDSGLAHAEELLSLARSDRASQVIG